MEPPAPGPMLVAQDQLTIAANSAVRKVYAPQNASKILSETDFHYIFLWHLFTLVLTAILLIAMYFRQTQTCYFEVHSVT